MKEGIHKLYPELRFCAKNQANWELLCKAAREAWHATDPEILKNLVDTMPHRVAAVMKLKDGTQNIDTVFQLP